MGGSKHSHYRLSVVVGFSKLIDSKPLAPEHVIGQGTWVYSVAFREERFRIMYVRENTMGKNPNQIFHGGRMRWISQNW